MFSLGAIGRGASSAAIGPETVPQAIGRRSPLDSEYDEDRKCKPAIHVRMRFVVVTGF